MLNETVKLEIPKETYEFLKELGKENNYAYGPYSKSFPKIKVIK